MEIETVLCVVLLACYYAWCIGVEIRDRRKEHEAQIARQQKRARIVVARCKYERIGEFWKCRYFSFGDQVGFFRKKPSSGRVLAVMGEVDQNLKMRELIEDHDFDDLLYSTH